MYCGTSLGVSKFGLIPGNDHGKSEMAIDPVFRERHKKIHLVGIGGIGMSGIARVLLESGFEVSGSDISDGPEQRALASLGAKVHLGHHAQNVSDADILVYSSAVNINNPEIAHAREQNIPIIPRALMLAELMRLRCGIAISGAHGKTTTTSLIGTLMHRVGLDPTVVIGGIVNHFGTNAVVGKSQFMVTEADESDGTFLHLSPSIAVVTNIDAEHLDFYRGGLAEVKEKFCDFLNGLPFFGLAVVCLDDANIRSILPSINRRVITYGLHPDAIYRAENIAVDGFHTKFDLRIKDRPPLAVSINMVGQHNVLNTLAAFAVLEEIGVAANNLIEALAAFNGVKRRFTCVSNSKSFTVIDDYAHHPTEIRAVLKAARASFAKQRLRVIFQPHRFSRTRDLLEDFAISFTDCDSLVVTEIYGATEEPIPGINANALINAIKKATGKRASFAEDIRTGATLIADATEHNDVVLVLGAGSITHAAPIISDLLSSKYDANHET